jgi:hypothetical protein
MFIPKQLRDWQPEHMRATPMRRCHLCASGPHRLGELIQVLESPMRYHFCNDACLRTWQQTRHDEDMVEWLKMGTGQRAKIQQASANGPDAPPA